MHLLNKYSHYIFIVLLILSIQLSTHMIIDSLIYRTMLISSIAFVWLIVLFFNKNLKIFFNKWDSVSLLLLLYFCAGLFWSNTYSLAVTGISKLLLFFVVFIILNLFLSRKSDMAQLLIKAIVVAFLVSLFSFIRQIISLDDFSYSSFYNLTGISGHKNLYSSFVFLTLIGSFVGLQYFRGHKIWYVLVVCSVILQILTILILRARAVWLACVISFVIYIVLSLFKTLKIRASKIWFYSLIVSILSTLFFLFILPIILNTYLSHQLKSSDITEISDLGTFSERVKVWNKTYELIEENTIWGVGNGNWKINISKYSLPEIYKVQDLNVIFQRPHNEYLKILAENGVFGLFIFLYALSFFCLSLFSVNNKFSNSVSKCLFSGFLGFCVIMFFSFPLERVEHGLIITFLLSITYFSISNNKERNSHSFSKGLLFIPLLACLFITCIFHSKYKSSYYLKKMYYERNLGNNKKVVALCDSAITTLTKIDDFTIPIHWYRGNANANMNNFKIALNDFKIAKRYNPYNANVLNDLGSAYTMNSKIDSALYFYEQATIINPRFDDPKLNLVAIYINQKNVEMAKKWEKEILHDSDRRAYYRELISQMEIN